MRSARQSHAIACTGLCALLLFSVAYFAIGVFDAVDTVRHASAYIREPFYPGDANWGAVGLQTEAEVAGMKFSDAVRSVNGRPIDGFIVYYGALRRARAGDSLRVQTRSAGDTAVRDLSIELHPNGGMHFYLKRPRSAARPSISSRPL